MGVDITKKHVKKGERREPKSEDPYLRLLVKLYKFLARRTNARFNRIILKRLCQSRTNRPPLSVKKLAQFTTGQREKIAVIVGAVTDDTRVVEVPKMTVCALKFTEGARARITKAGGECITFDQLALRAPLGNNTVLLRGPRNARVATRYFGRAPGVPHSKSRPRVANKSKNTERARGRRGSCGYKV